MRIKNLEEYPYQYKVSFNDIFTIQTFSKLSPEVIRFDKMIIVSRDPLLFTPQMSSLKLIFHSVVEIRHKIFFTHNVPVFIAVPAKVVERHGSEKKATSK